MYANGHEIGNHTQDHKYLQKLGAQEIRQQVEARNQAVAAITGEAPKTVRLPGGGKTALCLPISASRSYSGMWIRWTGRRAMRLHRCRPC
ncbi:MAG: polysaccharide deacetylase family protein [Clostridium fessum]